MFALYFSNQRNHKSQPFLQTEVTGSDFRHLPDIILSCAISRAFQKAIQKTDQNMFTKFLFASHFISPSHLALSSVAFERNISADEVLQPSLASGAASLLLCSRYSSCLSCCCRNRQSFGFMSFSFQSRCLPVAICEPEFSKG